MSTSNAVPASVTEIPMDQWAWWCHDNKAVQDRDLGLANCLVCAQEPTEVMAWECREGSCFANHLDRDVIHHALFKGCMHQVDVTFSWDSLARIHP
ncbi:hypothetical protein ACFUJX_20170 [Streptomyces rubiginosohelvolus]|uniref:hypothetical protein n=1 Tax=Streptomyces rubiginosohelvolus TaxID=67362 RepID=UPI003639FEAA